MRYLLLVALALNLASAEPVRHLDRVRPLRLETPLQGAVISADGPLRPLGERLAEAIRKTCGVTVEVREQLEPTVLAEHDVIAIGNAIDNPLVRRLYGMRLTYLDAIYPGDGMATGGFDAVQGDHPQGWGYTTPTGPTHAQRLDSETYRSAPNSVRIDGSAAGRGCILRDLPAKPGDTVNVSLWYRGAYQGDGYGLVHLDAYRDQQVLTSQDLRLPPAAQWQQRGLSLTVPAGATQTRLLLYLYNRGTVQYDDVRAEVAGRDLLSGTVGRVVHTVCDPLGTGHNAVVVGGSSPAGHEAAVNALIARLEALKTPVLPRLLDVQLGDSAVAQGLVGPGPDPARRAALAEAARKSLATNAFVPVRDTFQTTLSWARNYLLTGDERHAEMAKALWAELLATPASNAHGPMEWIFRAIEGWQLLESSPTFSDADRLAITNRLLEIGCANETAYARNVQNVNRLIADGHQLDQGLCLYLHGLYFDRYYHVNGHWMTLAQPLIDLAEKAPRVHDSYAYGPIIGNDFMTEYALKTGHFGYFESGSAKQAAEWAMLCSDNLGAGGTFGDDGAWRGEVPVTLLSKAWGYYRDDRLLWPLRSVRPPLGCFATRTPAKEPTDLLGVAVAPLHPLLYQTALQQIADPVAKAAWKPDDVPPAQAFDKLSFRAGWTPDDAYLLVDGVNTIPHGHRDGASILRYTDRGRLWLTEGHYIEIAKERHNTLVVNREGAAADGPPLAALTQRVSRPDLGLARVVTRAYNGTDWARTIAWLPGEGFAVLDRVTAREAGTYGLTLHWQTLGEVSLRNGTLTATQDGEGFTLQNLDGADGTLVEELHEHGSNYYASYPHSRDGLVKHLQQSRRVHLDAGQSYTFLNLLSAHPGAEPTLRGARLAADRLSIQGAGGAWVVADGPTEATVTPGPGTEPTPAAPAAPAAFQAPGFTPVGTVSLPPLRRNWAADEAARISSTIAPLPASTWTPDYRIALDDLLHRRDAIVLWEADQAPVITVDLRAPRPVSALVLRTMWTNNSARNLAYRFERATVETAPSPDGPWTAAGTLEEKGTPELGSTPAYTLALPGTPLRAVRLTFKPKAGASLFLKGLDLLGPSDESAPPAGLVPFGSAAGTALAAADLDGSGRDTLLIGTADGLLLAAAPDGQTRWSVPLLGTARVLTTGDLDGDGRPEILAGTDGQRLWCFGADGKERWHHDFAFFWGRKGNVNTVVVADVDGDKRNEVVVGTESWHYFLLGPDGQERWQYEALHAATHAAVADLDGDGKLEILAGHEYYGPKVLSAEGKERFAVYGTGPWCTRAAAADLTGDGKPDVAMALEDDTIHLRDGKGTPIADVNVGGWVTGLETVKTPAGDVLIAGVASPWWNLVALGQGGAVLWRRDLPSPVTCLAKTPTGVVAGCQGGQVVAVDAAGNIQAVTRPGLPIAAVTPCRTAQGAAVAVLGGNTVRVLRP